jgi:hypothetical protein
MSVTAKFKVNRISDMGWAHEVELTPDYQDGRNKEWAEATPAGMIRLTIKNQVAADVFKAEPNEQGSQAGKQFVVTFEAE